jgi:hypothetical protein
MLINGGVEVKPQSIGCGPKPFIKLFQKFRFSLLHVSFSLGKSKPGRLLSC